MITFSRRALLVCGFMARRNENDGQVGTHFSRSPAKLEAVDNWHADIGNQAIYLTQHVAFEERLRG
ncbi:hypothetical protein MesoLj113a_18930 [Mesorhizobium sp. 113-1-2]|nr:hypothetical protein MesoLj113a_18930 [Mesorhizobium sp. 113-1-2]